MPSKCGFCKATSWEIHEESPAGSQFKVYFARCSMCKVPIGVLPYYDLYTKLKNVEDKNNEKFLKIASALDVIDGNIRRLFMK